ncbi:MAG TPA: dihydroorotate dehydrogenase [Candidatus Limnocylindrales bacterium]|nr:dihydroorotate dehydrogenase [Candidatus Limnocylindrales bacterium]
MVDCFAVSLPASVRRPTDVDLSVRIGTLLLSNPVIAASGTFGYGVEFAHLVDLNSLGGIVVKGLSAQPLAGAPAPRLCESAAGMINAVGLQNIGVRAFVAEKLPELRKYRTAIIANVFGHTVAEYVEVIRVLEEAEGVAAYELNISCPNVDHGGAEFGLDPALTTEVVTAARQAARRPLWVKLAPNADVKAVAKAAEEAGADAVTVANTYPAMSIDARSGKSKLGRRMGGLSGPAIKPLTLRLVYEVSRAVKIPVIGLGGIETAEDAVEYMRAGATAIQVGTAHFADPRASKSVVEGLRHHCTDLSIYRISGLIGSVG